MNQNPEPLTYTGLWWLADTPDQQVAGTLTINPGGENELKLLGKFGGQSDLLEGPIRFKEVEHGTVLGRAEEDDAHEPITLYGCSETRLDPDFVSHFTGVTESTLTPEVVLVGVHLADREATFGEFEGQLLGLESWTHLSVPSPRLEFDDAGKVKAISHRFEPPYPTSFELPHRGTLSFPVQFSAGKKGVAAYSVAYRTPVALKVEGGATLDWFLETIFDLQILVSILMGKAARTVGLKGRIRHEDDPATHRIRFEEFEIYFRSRYAWVRLPEQQTEEDELLALPQVEDDLEIVLARWFGNADKFRQAASLYYDNLDQSGGFTALRFLTTAQAVETAHRRLFGDSHFLESDVAGYEAVKERVIADLATADLSPRFRSSLKDKLRYLPHDALRWRLKDLWNRSEGVLEHHVPDRDGFCETVRVTRDYFTHYSKELEERAADGLQLAMLTVQLEVMLVTTFLLALGVPTAKVSDAVRAFSAYNWIRNHLAVRPDDG